MATKSCDILMGKVHFHRWWYFTAKVAFDGEQLWILNLFLWVNNFILWLREGSMKLKGVKIFRREPLSHLTQRLDKHPVFFFIGTYNMARKVEFRANPRVQDDFRLCVVASRYLDAVYFPNMSCVETAISSQHWFFLCRLTTLANVFPHL